MPAHLVTTSTSSSLPGNFITLLILLPDYNPSSSRMCNWIATIYDCPHFQVQRGVPCSIRVGAPDCTGVASLSITFLREGMVMWKGASRVRSSNLCATCSKTAAKGVSAQQLRRGDAEGGSDTDMVVKCWEAVREGRVVTPPVDQDGGPRPAGEER